MVFQLGLILLLSVCGMSNVVHPLAAAVDTVPGPSGKLYNTPCTPTTGYIYVSGDTLDGYFSSHPNAFAGYGNVTGTTEDALRVSFCRPNDPDFHSSLTFEIKTLNGFEAFPLLGGVKGYYSTDSDLNATSGDYAYIAGTVSVPKGPAVPANNSFSNNFMSYGIPLEPVESFIWTISASDALHPVWTNSDDRSVVEPPLVHYVDPGSGNQLYLLVGNPALFLEKLGGSLLEVEFTFVDDTVALHPL